MSHQTKRVAIFGDTHFPFQSNKAIDRAVNIVKEFKPDMVIQVGDLYDMFSFSKYPHGPNLITPEAECLSGRVGAEAFWNKIGSVVPSSTKRVQLVGNHDERITKLSLGKLPAYKHINDSYLKGLMSFPGVQTVHDSKEEFIYDGVCYMHGFRKHGEHAVYNQMNTVVGHLHRGGLVYNQNLNGTYFELNVGWLGDKKSPVFNYHSQNKITKTTLGLGLIDSLGPRFVSLD